MGTTALISSKIMDQEDKSSLMGPRGEALLFFQVKGCTWRQPALQSHKMPPPLVTAELSSSGQPPPSTQLHVHKNIYQAPGHSFDFHFIFKVHSHVNGLGRRGYMNTRALSFLWSGIRRNMVKGAKFPHLRAAILQRRKSKFIVSFCTQMLAVLFSAALFKRAISEYKSILHIPGTRTHRRNVLSALFYLL